jgi:uncharacterized membrane protein YhaH (DUF805 family)
MELYRLKDRNNLYKFQTPKSQNDESSILGIKGRIDRLTFSNRLLWSVCVFLLSSFVQNVFSVENLGIRLTNFIEIIHLFLLPILLLVFIVVQGAKRMHDVNLSGWFFLFPFYNFYLCFLPGTVGVNDYGIEPLPSHKIQFFDQLEGENHRKNSIVNKNYFFRTKLDRDSRRWLSLLTAFVLNIVIFFSFGNLDLLGVSQRLDNVNDLDALSSANNQNINHNLPHNSLPLEKSQIKFSNESNNSRPKDSVEVVSDIPKEMKATTNFNGLPFVVSPIKRNPNSRLVDQNQYFDSRFTLFDANDKEYPIFPVNKDGKLLYQIFFCSEAELLPYYGEFTPEKLEELKYYKFKDEQSCLEFCRKRKKTIWEGRDNQGVLTQFKKVNSSEWVETNQHGINRYLEIQIDGGKTVLKDISRAGVMIFLSSENCFYKDSLKNWSPVYSGRWIND